MKIETIYNNLNELSKNTNTGVIQGHLVVGYVIAKYKIHICNYDKQLVLLFCCKYKKKPMT